MQETQVLNQLLWLPLIFLSGATFPLRYLPTAVQRVGLFLPATYLVNGLQQAVVYQVGPQTRYVEILSLTFWALLTFFLSAQLFRWEPEAKIPRRAKLLVAATAIPFLLLGAWENKSDRILLEAKSAFESLNAPDAAEKEKSTQQPKPGSQAPQQHTEPEKH
jgi:hypothetical protein